MSENDNESMVREANLESKNGETNNYGMCQTFTIMNKKQSIHSNVSNEQFSPQKPKFKSIEVSQNLKSKRNGSRHEKRSQI